MKQDLQRYSHILSADDHYTSWQEVVLPFLNYYISIPQTICQFHHFPQKFVLSVYMRLNENCL